MFTDANFAAFQEGSIKDDDGAKRVFFGGERFIEGIAGQAYVMQIWPYTLIPIELCFLLEICLILGNGVYNFSIMIRSQYRGQN